MYVKSETLNKLTAAFMSTDAEQRIVTLKMEIDYELMTLHDAIQAGDNDAITQSKNKLAELHKQGVLLEVI